MALRRSVIRARRRRCCSSLAEAVHADAAAGLVGILERHLHALQQFVGAAAVRRKQAYPARQAQIEAHGGQVEAAADGGQQLLGVEQRALRRTPRHHHQELRLAQPRNGVVTGDRLAQAARRLAQHLIAHLQAERGVDVAQVAQLEQQQRGARLALAAADQALQPALHQRAVGQLRERIVIGVVGDVGLARRDVALHGVEGGREPLELLAAGHVDRRAVLAALDALRRPHQLADRARGAATEHRTDEGGHQQRRAVDEQHRVAQLAVGQQHVLERLRAGSLRPDRRAPPGGARSSGIRPHRCARCGRCGRPPAGRSPAPSRRASRRCACCRPRRGWRWRPRSRPARGSARERLVHHEAHGHPGDGFGRAHRGHKQLVGVRAEDRGSWVARARSRHPR